jgi:hypothetical protein
MMQIISYAKSFIFKTAPGFLDICDGDSRKILGKIIQLTISNAINPPIGSYLTSIHLVDVGASIPQVFFRAVQLPLPGIAPWSLLLGVELLNLRLDLFYFDIFTFLFDHIEPTILI